jgi:hypothetical protein
MDDRIGHPPASDWETAARTKRTLRRRLLGVAVGAPIVGACWLGLASRDLYGSLVGIVLIGGVFAASWMLIGASAKHDAGRTNRIMSCIAWGTLINIWLVIGGMGLAAIVSIVVT